MSQPSPRPLDCDRPEGHEWELITRHPDPPGYEGVLPNAICVHCSEQRYIKIEDEPLFPAGHPDHAPDGWR